MKRYNTKIITLNGIQKITICSRQIFSDEIQKRAYLKKPQKKGTKSRNDSIRRSVQKAEIIINLNKFDYFITFTLDSKKINRYDIEQIKEEIKKWLKNKVRYNNLKYIIIPEFHKDGAVHFHGLIKGDLQMSDSGKKTEKGQIIYNLDNWILGYSTCIPLYGDYSAVTNYVLKYIVKDTKKIFGNYYLAGGKLIREPIAIEYYNCDYRIFNQKEYCNGYCRFKYVDVPIL